MTLPFVEVNKRLTGLQVAEAVGLEPARERNKFACPSCSSSDGLHAYPEPGGGAYCFPRSASFSAVDLAMAAWGLDAADACRRLAERFGIRTDAPAPPPPPKADPKPDKVEDDPRRQVVYGTLVSSLKLGPRGRKYLEGRGLNPDFAAVQGLRSIETPDEWESLRVHLVDQCGGENVEAAGFGAEARPWWPWRGAVPALVLPYFDSDGIGVHHVRFRRITPGPRRYVAPMGPGHRIPWRVEAFEGPRPLEIVVVESELDALALLEHGCDAVALGGATPHRAVISWLVAALGEVQEAALWLDDDEAGQRSVKKLTAALVEKHGAAWARGHIRVWRSEQDPAALARAGRL